jgi:FlaA1/EpsC-like NDP-sugar epimerase
MARHTVDGVRRRLWCVVDALAIVVCFYVAATLRFDLDLGQSFSRPVTNCLILAVAAHLLIGTLWGPYAVGHVGGSYEEILDIAETALLWMVPLFFLVLAAPVDLGPRSLPVTGGALSVLGMFGARFVLRAVRTRAGVTNTSESRRTLIFGAGEGGRQLVRALVRDPGAGLVPVAVLDDDPRKRRLRIDGVRVLGNRNDLIRVAQQAGAEILAIAVPSATSDMLNDLRARAEDAGLDVRVLPPPRELLGRIGVGDLRSLDLADLLGRRPVHVDEAAIGESIRGKVVLVTGAGGSIGSELCRQIARYEPARLILLDRDESLMHATRLTLTGTALLDSDDMVLVDIRDREALLAAFAANRPQVVFHAAALKHLSLLERFPQEALKTNVLGTRNVLAAAEAVGVTTFVNIFTDKAAAPTSVLGYSKRLTERLTAAYGLGATGTFVSVRFGNVLGSRGSMLDTFRAQIARGGPVTVTHPDVRRFFMLIPEAAQLVLQAAVIGDDGEVLVLEMGDQVRILDVARTLIDLSGREGIEVRFTGLRPGEKLAEDLFSDPEHAQLTTHDLVTSVRVPPLDPRVLPDPRTAAGDVNAWMRETAADEDLTRPRRAVIRQ